MLLGRLVRRTGTLALDQLLPPRCGVCGRAGALLCAACERSLPPVTGSRCAQCWQLVRAGICPRCEEYGNECTAIRACYDYSGAAQKLVSGIKYAGLHALSEPVARLMAADWMTHGFTVDQVIAVPLHPRRERTRGFNQARLLADGVAARLGVAHNSTTLVRVRQTPPQARAGGRSERRANVFSAFACSNARVAGAGVLLIDDVTTTGATLRACAMALFDGGAAAVYGFAFAIAD